jgi:hypothetical protein
MKVPNIILCSVGSLDVHGSSELTRMGVTLLEMDMDDDQASPNHDVPD